MMIPIPRAGVLRAVRGREAALAVPGIEEVTISAHVGQELVPLPEGSRYLGFILARAESPEAVEDVAPGGPPPARVRRRPARLGRAGRPRPVHGSGVHEGALRVKLVIHPAVEPERLAKIVEAARPMAVVNAGDEARGARGDRRRRRLLRQAHARAARGRAAAPLGAGAHGEPRALHVPGARGAPLRAHEHARALLGRDRRPRVRLRPLLRAELPPLHPEPARGALGARRRRGGAVGLRHGPRPGQRRRPRPPPPGRRHARRRRARADRLRDRPARARLRDAGPGRRPGPDGGAARGWRPSGGWTGCPTSSGRATSW